MAIIKCVRGHFYDSSKSDECPYCARTEQETEAFQKVIQNSPNSSYSRAMADMEQEAVTQAWRPVGGMQDIHLRNGYGTGTAGISAGDEPVTVGLFSPGRGTAYVTGWLVCVDGPGKGRDYRICHGMNWIGSSPVMDIVLYSDAQVAPVRHCSIAYDGKSNRFFAVAGSGSITYYNGSLLEDSHELHPGDELKIGSSTYEFVPFCREGRTWEEKEEKKAEE
ncbi:MAG: FHA domain-containing protein [Clostridiales bacterium]|nr:FHA domain-containing protein [Clostridiales bacterium]